jgi:hypothetical protein
METPPRSGGVNRTMEVAEATGSESAPSEPRRCTVARPYSKLPSVSLTPPALALAEGRALTPLVPRPRSPPHSRARADDPGIRRDEESAIVGR